MQEQPIILLISSDPTSLEAALQRRYDESYNIIAAAPDVLLNPYKENNERIALFIYDQVGEGTNGALFLEKSRAIYPETRRLLLSETSDPTSAMLTINSGTIDYYIVKPWTEKQLYPILDELLADWRASVDMPFMRVKGIMTVAPVRVRIGDSLHRAAEVIALSGIGDLMVLDNNNHFVGVLSVGDVLRAAMPDIGEIMEAGGTLEQAFRLFLRKGSELMYRPIEPMVIRNPLVVDPDDHVAKAATLMLEKNIHRLPVVRDGRLLGTIGRTDVCQAVVGIS